jgi:hypothetical protein
MNSLHLWMGIAIGIVVALLIVWAIVSTGTKKNAAANGSFNERTLAELKLRNEIGIRQCEALEAIACILDGTGEFEPWEGDQ